MRIILELTAPIEPLPFDHINHLLGRFHGWLGGNNSLHNSLSLYSIGWLQGGRKEGNVLHFDQGATWPISFHDTAYAKKLISAIKEDPSMPFGMRVRSAQLLHTPKTGRMAIYRPLTPVLVRLGQDAGPPSHLRYDDPRSENLLTYTLQTKLEAAGMSAKARACFMPASNARTKLVQISGQSFRANLCPVRVEGDPEAVAFALDVGIGALTGCGLGALDYPKL